jgi:putative component of toxin-antitoxin plasmid stabilization module
MDQLLGSTPRELEAMFDNLDTVHEALSADAKIEAVRNYGFVHPEPIGIIAVDQKGGGAGLKTCRLYLYPKKETQTIYLLTIGDKATQKNDIPRCKKLLKNILQG